MGREFSETGSGVLASFGLPWRMLRDGATGATVLSVKSPDGDNFAGVCFRTPAPDSRGIPHVLEHCVLNGSSRFPVRDAFNELWRGSLHSYLNAVTGPDRTVYYAGSPHPGDFRNLLAVYLDLLFDPLLDPVRVSLESFHYEPRLRRGRKVASPSGVIYSEMRGSYSDPDEVSSIAIQAAMLPGTPYRFDSGGDPAQMHRLTHGDIVRYHREHYHTGNCLFFVYSPMEAQDALALVCGLLPRRSGEAPRAGETLPLQRRWGRPRSLRLAVPSGSGGQVSANVSWLLDEVSDSRGTADWQMLEEILLSESGVLSRALMDSRYGSDISPESGLDIELRQALLTVGMKGCSESAARLVRGLVFRNLEEFARAGPGRDQLDAAVNTLLTRYVEKVDDFPLRLFTRALRAWTYGADPGGWMDHASDLEAAASGDAAGRLAAIVRSHLLENTHRLNSLVLPSRPARGGLGTPVGGEAFERLKAEHSAMQEYASASDDPGALSSIPRTSPSDISPEALPMPFRPSASGGIPFTLVDLPGCRTIHVEVAFDLSGISTADQPLVPLLARCLGGMPAGDLPFEALSRRLAAETGGMDCEPLSFLDRGGGRRARAFLVISIPCLAERLAGAVDLLGRVVGSTSMSDEDRFGELVSEMRSDVRADMVPCCDVFARLAAGACSGGSAALYDLWEGMPQHALFEDLSSSSAAWRGAASRVGRLLDSLLSGGVSRVAIGADPSRLDGTMAAVAEALSGIGRGAEPGFADVLPEPCRATLIRWDTSVSSVCLSGRAPLFTEHGAGVFTVGATMLADGLLYRGLRTAGGSYEVSAWHDRLAGIISMCSYRDPDPARTMRFMERLPAVLAGSPPSAEDVRLAVLSSLAPLEKPVSHRTLVRHALVRGLAGLGRSDYTAFRRSLLAVGRDALCETFPGMLEYSLAEAGRAALVPRWTDPGDIFPDVDSVAVLPRRNGNGRNR